MGFLSSNTITITIIKSDSNSNSNSICYSDNNSFFTITNCYYVSLNATASTETKKTNPAFESLRSKQPVHLSDTDLKLIIKRKRNLKCLDICPCNLTNRSIVLINKYLGRNLKYLRLQNCCNWLPDETKGGDSDDELLLAHQQIELPNLLAENVRLRVSHEDNGYDNSDEDDSEQNFLENNENEHNDFFVNPNNNTNTTSTNSDVLRNEVYSLDGDQMFENE